MPPATTMTPPITNNRLVRGISKPKTEKLETGVLSVEAKDVVDASGLGVEVDSGIEDVTKGDVTDDVVAVELDETERTVDVDVSEMTVDVIETDAFPVVPIITTEVGKLSSTVAYPLVSWVGPLTNTNTK